MYVQFLKALTEFIKAHHRVVDAHPGDVYPGVMEAYLVMKASPGPMAAHIGDTEAHLVRAKKEPPDSQIPIKYENAINDTKNIAGIFR